MRVRSRTLRRWALAVATLSVVTQIVLAIVCFGQPQWGDAPSHLGLAYMCAEAGQWYPMTEQMQHGTWFICQGLINFLILQIRLFGTADYNSFFNILMNVAILYETYWLGKRLFNKETGYVAVILTSLLTSTIFIPLQALTEVPFLFLCLTGLCLSLRPGVRYALLAGLMYALANTVRPLAIVFMATSVLHYICNGRKVKSLAAMCAVAVAVTAGVGCANYAKTGFFVVQSTTSGANLLQTSYDGATGLTRTVKSRYGENIHAFRIDGLDTLNVVQKDSVWRAMAIDWIREHPGRAAGLYLKKIPLLYAEDGWAKRLYDQRLVNDSLPQEGGSAVQKVRKLARLIWPSAVYYIVCVLFVISVIHYRRQIVSPKGLVLALLVMGTLATCVVVTMPRYHYPYTFALILWSSYWLAARTTSPQP